MTTLAAIDQNTRKIIRYLHCRKTLAYQSKLNEHLKGRFRATFKLFRRRLFKRQDMQKVFVDLHLQLRLRHWNDILPEYPSIITLDTPLF